MTTKPTAVALSEDIRVTPALRSRLTRLAYVAGGEADIRVEMARIVEVALDLYEKQGAGP